LSQGRRKVLITGASSGIGAETARRLDARGDGDLLALLARSLEGLERVAGDLRGDPLLLDVDVTDRAALGSAIERVEAELGGLDVVVICAAAGAFGPFAEINPDDFDRSLDVTFRGAVDTIRAVLDPLERRGGVIVVVGSVAGRVPLPLLSPYAAAKHALRGFVRSLRCELRGSGSKVSICLVDPGPVDTPFWQHASSFDGRLPPRLRGAYRAEDVAAEIERLAGRGRGDSAVGAAMELWRVLDLLLPPITERLVGWAAMRSLRLDRGEAADPELAAPTGKGTIEGGLAGRPSALTAARGVLERVGLRL